MATIRLSVRTRPVLFAIGLATLLIVSGSFILQMIGALYGHDHIFGLLPLLHIDREGNLPSWLSSALLATCAIAAWSLGTDRRTQLELTMGWRIAAALLLFMSVDEGAQVHERVGDLVQPLLPEVGIFYFGWVAVAIVPLLAIAPLFVRFVRSLDRRTRRHFVAAAVIYLTGALGVEMVTGAYMAAEADKMSVTYIALSHIEELLEMIGVIVLLKGMLDHADRLEGKKQIEYA